jgi:predicted aldo/keto reductase-like oxidoreductase
MQNRTFGRLDWRPSALGFGAMRLPVVDHDMGKIDEPEATRMIRYAIDHGVNYVDTAYPYHRGTSEAAVGRALQDGYRERVHLATKMPCWLVKEPADFDRYLNEQLERLQATFLDFYLLHSLSGDSWPPVRDLGVLAWAERALADGRIRHLGFSFHDRYEVFQEIVDASDLWTFCQIQYNYMDEENQAGRKGLQYAASRGLAVVVMEPIRGGQLTNPPDSVAALWATAPRPRAPAEWALQWVWNQPEVSLLLSGMSTMEQVVENVASAGRSGPGTLTAEELAVVGRVRDAYRALIPISCTDCKYCQPCPNGVNIPGVFEVYNEGVMYDQPERARMSYNWIKPEARADQCIECGECEDKCPQQIEIIVWLKRVQEYLAG